MSHCREAIVRYECEVKCSLWFTRYGGNNNLPRISVNVNCIGNGILICCQFCTESNSGLVQVLYHRNIVIRKQSCIKENSTVTKLHLPKCHTLQISSPWKPPATIKPSLTAMVLICTRESGCANNPGFFCTSASNYVSIGFYE